MDDRSVMLGFQVEFLGVEVAIGDESDLLAVVDLVSLEAVVLFDSFDDEN